MNQHSCGSNTCVFGPPRGMGTNGPCTCLGEGRRITNLEAREAARKITAIRMELVESNAALMRMMRDRDEYYDKSQELAGELETLRAGVRETLIQMAEDASIADVARELWKVLGDPVVEATREGVYNRGAGTCQSGMDGECNWDRCPQLRDGEPAKSGRHCPLWKDPED